MFLNVLVNDKVLYEQGYVMPYVSNHMEEIVRMCEFPTGALMLEVHRKQNLVTF
jgi:hypothetical protein